MPPPVGGLFGGLSVFPSEFCLLHVRGDGGSMFLYVELGSTFRLSVDVVGDGGVEALRVVADVGDDQGVATAGLKDVDVLPLLHSSL